MTVTAFSGPIVTIREDPLGGFAPVNVSANQNPDAGPSMFHMAMALLDPRPQYTYETGQAQSPVGFNASGVAISGAPTLGWLSATFQVADYAPGTASTTSLAPTNSNVTASTTVNLTTSNYTGYITTASTCTNATNGQTVTGLWQIDNTPAGYTFGTGTYGVWDPANPPIGRCISISTPTNTTMSTTTFTITGYDAYGYPITQAMQGPLGGSTTYSTKAFKWISSITVGATTSNTFSIGVSDTYGLPMYASAVGYIRAFWENKSVENSTATTFTAGSAAIATTSSDVRGTIGIAGVTISNGARKLQMWQSVAPSNLTVGSLFGTTPPA